MKTNGTENINGKSYEDIRQENKPSKPKKNIFNVGDQIVMTVGAVSVPAEDSTSEVDYLFVGGKSGEWIGEGTLLEGIPLEKDTAYFVSGYKAGFLDGWKAAQEKDQEYIMQFMNDVFSSKDENQDAEEA